MRLVESGDLKREGKANTKFVAYFEPVSPAEDKKTLELIRWVLLLLWVRWGSGGRAWGVM